MFNQGRVLEEKRNKIIMACLSGGQHIDAALEAADRLVPQSSIDEAREEDRKLWDEWRRIGEVEKMKIKTSPVEANKSNPWYVSSISRWLPF